jgi:hypothetical protein
MFQERLDYFVISLFRVYQLDQKVQMVEIINQFLAARDTL